MITRCRSKFHDSEEHGLATFKLFQASVDSKLIEKIKNLRNR